MILVTGATGFIGRHLVRELLAQDLPVRCLIPENRARRLPWDAENADRVPDVVLGNILDDEAMYQAVTGVDTIIHLESAQWWGNERNLERIELAGTRNLVSVARSARVGRIITMSHLGASISSAYTLHRIKGQVEEIIRNSGLAYTIIRSGIVFGEDDAFINNLAMSLALNPVLNLMPGQGEIALHPIYIDDIVQCLTLSLESLDAVDNIMEVGGPEYITYEDLLFTLMRITGNRRLIIAVPPYLLRLFARIYGLVFPRSLTTPQWLDILATNRTTQLGNTFTYFGVRPRRIEDTLLTYMKKRNYWFQGIRTIFRRRPRSL
ncbi:MAG: complex I NDUFA9 subunit family protein [Phototrophicaceae bacterium]